jgi:hypothetical protein
MAATGGQTVAPKDLWPEPRHQAHKSDLLENAWHKQVCSGTLRLKQARAGARLQARTRLTDDTERAVGQAHVLPQDEAQSKRRRSAIKPREAAATSGSRSLGVEIRLNSESPSRTSM